MGHEEQSLSKSESAKPKAAVKAKLMHSTSLFTIASASYRNELRAKFLADAIPATSFATGANFTGD